MSPSMSEREAEACHSRSLPVGNRPLLPAVDAERTGGVKQEHRQQEQPQQRAGSQKSFHMTPGFSNTLRRSSHTDTVAIVPATLWMRAREDFLLADHVVFVGIPNHMT